MNWAGAIIPVLSLSLVSGRLFSEVLFYTPGADLFAQLVALPVRRVRCDDRKASIVDHGLEDYEHTLRSGFRSLNANSALTCRIGTAGFEPATP
jgi:hypothetical protein